MATVWCYRRTDVKSDNGNTIIIPAKPWTYWKLRCPPKTRMWASTLTWAMLSFGLRTSHDLSFDWWEIPWLRKRNPESEQHQDDHQPQELLSSLKRISFTMNKTTHQVRLKITGSELQVSAEDLDFSNEANERLSMRAWGWRYWDWIQCTFPVRNAF